MVVGHTSVKTSMKTRSSQGVNFTWLFRVTSKIRTVSTFPTLHNIQTAVVPQLTTASNNCFPYQQDIHKYDPKAAPILTKSQSFINLSLILRKSISKGSIRHRRKKIPRERHPYCDFSFVPKSLQKQPQYANRACEEPGSETAGILIQVQSHRSNSKAPDSNQKKKQKNNRRCNQKKQLCKQTAASSLA